MTHAPRYTIDDLPPGPTRDRLLAHRAADSRETRRYTLPYPPTVNTYWRNTPQGVRISAKGRAYRSAVQQAVLRHGYASTPLSGPLRLTATFYPPDKRRRDLDNVNKALWDAMDKAGVYEDDSQIIEAHTRMWFATKRGGVEVTLEPITDNRER